MRETSLRGTTRRLSERARSSVALLVATQVRSRFSR